MISRRRRGLALVITGLATVAVASAVVLSTRSPAGSTTVELADVPRCEITQRETPGQGFAEVALSDLPQWARAALSELPLDHRAQCYRTRAVFNMTGDLEHSHTEIYIPGTDAEQYTVQTAPSGSALGGAIAINIGMIDEPFGEVRGDIPQELEKVGDGVFRAIDYNHGLTELIYAVVRTSGRHLLLSIEGPPGSVEALIDTLARELSS